MRRYQFWTLVVLAAPTPLLIGLVIGAIFGMTFDSDRVILLEQIKQALEERKANG